MRPPPPRGRQGPKKKKDAPGESLGAQQGIHGADARPHLVVARLYSHLGQLVPQGGGGFLAGVAAETEGQRRRRRSQAPYRIGRLGDGLCGRVDDGPRDIDEQCLDGRSLDHGF